MFGDYHDAAFNLNNAAASQGPEDTADYSLAGDRETDGRAIPAVPKSDAVRAILVLAAESAFALYDGITDSEFVAKLNERSRDLEQKLATMPVIDHGADYSLLLRRARKAVAAMNETVRREVLEAIDAKTDMDEVEARLQIVKGAAIEAGRALKLIEMLDSKTR